ncbi:MAG: hypothetical protein AABX99_01205, partial [Nanoarchaeota archaeon]
MSLTSTIEGAEYALSLFPKNEEELRGLIREKIKSVILTPEYKGKKSSEYIEEVVESLYQEYKGIITQRIELEHQKIRLETIR